MTTNLIDPLNEAFRKAKIATETQRKADKLERFRIEINEACEGICDKYNLSLNDLEE